MPIQSNNPLEEANAFYQRMIKECITDTPLEDGRFLPQLNFTCLIKLVKEQPVSSQILTQLLADPPEEENEVAQLHGTWLMMALIAAFGPDSDLVKLTRRTAPNLYETAVRKLQDEFGS
jgi:hypothetical protein